MALHLVEGKGKGKGKVANKLAVLLQKRNQQTDQPVEGTTNQPVDRLTNIPHRGARMPVKFTV